MPVHLTFPQLAVLTVLAVASIAWLIFVTRILRRSRSGSEARTALPTPPVLPALPRQRQSGPGREAVELTPAERDAFAGLVRQLGGGR
ncbi:hypothetical protein OHU34_24295 [Streptomyces sp. NBC_00080]|uniref:hypothetical protein n=1 Tax=unclassified Streptomyces TaxID=2593676 RepID=UPI0006BACF5A|nr:hypothetical protein [Streptomyces sp. SLBN-115]KPI24215.1 hypothetical protein OV320_8877 [Actinobacteria bacterium OV320]TQJ53702.1 hypothetical protein FBY34_1442 [Streptomyces sp. SLBN-115]